MQDAWARLLTELGPPPFLVTATQIKSLTGVEPRLATKFDHREARPQALREATILPVRNGEYVVLPGDGYHDLESSGGRIISYRVAPEVRARTATLPWTSPPSSESQVLDMALVSGMLAEFLGEERLFLTIRGRLRAPRFGFTFAGEALEAEGVQVEADAGVEGDSLYLIEAKLGTRDNFHVRQLYYPFRMWRESCAKPVLPVFCCHSDRVFHFWLYDFAPADNYHGLTLRRAASYTLEEDVGTPTLRNLLDAYPRGALPALPFPQADRLERVIDLADAVASGASEYGFIPRQEGYYRNAAAFLGLLDPEFTQGTRAQRHAAILKRLVELPVFREACEYMDEHARFPPRPWVAERILANTSLRGTTLERRAGTVLAWLQWLSTHTLVAHNRTT